MSYLTTPTDLFRAATGAGPLGIGVPGFAHPLLAPTEWAELLRCSGDGHGTGSPVHWTVLNVSNGPGARPDPHCVPAASRLQGTGTRLIGHLDMGNGARPFGELVSDAHRYLEWYRVDGFWLDRCPTDRTQLSATRRITATLRALLDGAHLVLGHGTHPCPGYAECADQLVTFAGPWTDYRWSQVAEWTADHPPERFCHLVHGVPRTHLDEALRIARWQGAGTVYFTDHRDRGGDAWESLPGYWDEFVSRIGTGVSE
ncbi:spherulation-specific family 4 protein [Streptomyces halobius]|uniref:Spherulation-specific family 4 protein n=1 Tax=Streptomyces halobius TaxID=2879846 RepID=A0ABY4MA04_9ACTN|nr:spherulation-specific family 4 protein [Streptomyces halobius]UQA93235.1 spherulation-specific family 4 protein [Streptomyces halobius]